MTAFEDRKWNIAIKKQIILFLNPKVKWSLFWIYLISLRTAYVMLESSENGGGMDLEG